MPGILCDDPDRHPVFRISPAITILNKNILTLEIGSHTPLQLFKSLRAVGPVYFSPPDLILAGGLLHNKFIVWRSSGKLPGPDNERSEMSQDPFIPLQGLLIQGRCGQIPIDILEVVET
jgi:hypothetical protein